MKIAIIYKILYERIILPYTLLYLYVTGAFIYFSLKNHLLLYHE